MRIRYIAAVVVGVALAVSACGGSSDPEVKDAWARTSAQSQENGAVYMTITGGDSADRLVKASVSSDVAAMAQVHQTSMEDGVMKMSEVDAIDVPADGEVTLEPGGYHVMLMQLAEPLVSGEEIEVTLTFEDAGDIEVTAEVRDN